MRLILITIFLILAPLVYSQTDSTMVSNQALIETATELQKLRTENINLRAQNDNLRSQVVSLQNVNTNNLSIMNIKDREIELYKNFSLNVVPQAGGIYEKKWYEKPGWNFAMGVISGVGSIYLGAKIVQGL